MIQYNIYEVKDKGRSEPPDKSFCSSEQHKVGRYWYCVSIRLMHTSLQQVCY
jgi:hypothetical protein